MAMIKTIYQRHCQAKIIEMALNTPLYEYCLGTLAYVVNVKRVNVKIRMETTVIGCVYGFTFITTDYMQFIVNDTVLLSIKL